MNFPELFSFPGILAWFYGTGGMLVAILGLVMFRRASSKLPLKNTALVVLRGEAMRWHIPEAHP